MAQRLLEVVTGQAAAAGASRVTEVHLEVGDASGIDVESLTLHWQLQAVGTVAEGARLVILEPEDPRLFRIVSMDVDEAPPGPG